MPYRFENEVLLFSSAKYHPCADIILQKSDLLDDVTYYTSDLQLRIFCIAKIFKCWLQGIARR